MKKISLLILIIISVAAIHSCKKEYSPGPGNNPKDVYVSGIITSDTIISGATYQQSKAVYWKNGTPIVAGGGGRIAVSGSDIYVTGGDGYSKNGTYIHLTPVRYDQIQGSRNHIVISGSDVYVTIPDLSCIAKYWKNGGNPITLTSSSCAEAMSIAVSGTDVYVAGLESNGSNILVAKYWKNGVAVNLTDGTQTAQANSIAVVGSDVYVAGLEADNGVSVAKYWKNGNPISLTDGTKHAFAYSIAVVGSDVYVLGSEEKSSGTYIDKYWKNGTVVPLTIPVGNVVAEAFDITVSGSDVYVAGYILSGYTASGGYTVSKAVYWKNGTPVTLGNGAAYGVAVVP